MCWGSEDGMQYVGNRRGVAGGLWPFGQVRGRRSGLFKQVLSESQQAVVALAGLYSGFVHPVLKGLQCFFAHLGASCPQSAFVRLVGQQVAIVISVRHDTYII